jgi:hypothetical protein
MRNIPGQELSEVYEAPWFEVESHDAIDVDAACAQIASTA